MVRFPRCINLHPVPTHYHFRPMRANTVIAFSGIYVVLFGSSIKVLLNKRKAISGTTPLLALAGVLVALITWVSISHAKIHSSRESILTGLIFPPPFPRQHVITDAVRTVYAFKRDQVPLGPDLYYANVASAMSLIKTSLYLIITVIFDAFIVSFSYLMRSSVPT